MDVLICHFPPMFSWFLPPAPSILVGACNWLGLTSNFIDLAKVQAQAQTNPGEWAKDIVASNPKLIAFSLFSFQSQAIAKELASEIKKINPNIKIIAGGSGIKVAINSNDLSYITDLTNNNLVDYYYEGDSEYWWPHFLAEFFNINQHIDPNEEIPYLPDYSKYDISYYQNEAEKNNQPLWIPIVGSKGCVRKCTFCEIPDRWKFQQRNPDRIAEEMQMALQHIPNGTFSFADSLINGSIPAFDKLLDNIIKLKQDYPDLSWTGQFIIRNAKVANEEYWKKIAKSGAVGLQIGVETGSDRLRADMHKQFTNEELDQSLQYMEKFGLSCTFLLLVGYPTETDEDWVQTLHMLERYKKYANTTIKYIQPGPIMGINPGTPIYKEAIETKEIILTKDLKIWFNKKNINNTMEVRVARRKQLIKHATELGYSLYIDLHVMDEEINETIERNKNIIRLIEKQR